MTALFKAAYRDGDTVDLGSYQVRLSVNPRARGVRVRIDRHGEVVATAPRLAKLADALAFARTQDAWITAKLADCVRPEPFAPGQVISIKGHAVTLADKAGVISARPVQQADGSWQLVTSGDAATFARRVERYSRQQALKAVQAQTGVYTARLGVEGVKVSLFDAKGRWGSCTPGRKAIRYSWRIILAPPDVLNYLCAHEVAHLKHPDHSPRFWAEVTSLFGADYRPARRWLKTEGQTLFKYQS